MSLVSGCTTPKALLTENYDPSFYHIERQLSDSLTTSPSSFLVYGDPQSGWLASAVSYGPKNWFTWKQLLFPFYQLYLVGYAVYSGINYYLAKPDAGEDRRALMRRAIYTAAKDRPTDFVVILGDMAVSDGRRAQHWAEFLRENRQTPYSIIEDFPVLPVVGNHEFAADSAYGGPNYDAVWDYPPFYVQDMPHAALFVLNSNVILDQYDHLTAEEQNRLFEKWFVSADTSTTRAWLERQLAAREDRAFKIVAMHHPPISLAWHHMDWYQPANGPRLLEKRRKLLELFQEYNVQVVFSGHEHLYGHNILRYRTDEGRTRRMHFVISSGGGVPPRPETSPSEERVRLNDFHERGLDVVHVKQESVHHYTRVYVTADSLTVKTRAVAWDGSESLLDAFTVPAPPPDSRIEDGESRIVSSRGIE